MEVSMNVAIPETGHLHRSSLVLPPSSGKSWDSFKFARSCCLPFVQTSTFKFIKINL